MREVSPGKPLASLIPKADLALRVVSRAQRLGKAHSITY